MKKTIQFWALIALGSLTNAHATQSIKYDFEDGLPAGTELFDMDRNAAASDTRIYGFNGETAWVHLILPEDRNGVACSTSWYSPAGKSEDWMVLPPCEITSEACLLTWRAKASDSELSDGYKVCVSTKGHRPEYFNLSEPLFETKAEKGEWNSHELSLGKYNGQTVWIAFVNTSTDCAFLYVDDVYIGQRRALTVRPAMGTLCLPGESIPLKVAVGTEDNKSIQGVSVQIEAEGKIYKKDCPELVINPGEESILDLEASISPLPGTPVHCKLSATTGKNVTEEEFDLAAFRQTRVVEEYTGTWCGFCVRGIVALDQMKTQHPDDFIGIAIHCGGIDRDPMDSSNSAEDIPAWNFGGFPYAIMNRSKTFNGDPENIPRWYDDYGKQESLTAGLRSIASENDGEITINTDVWFAESNLSANWQLAYVIIENNVHCPDDFAYSQLNSYSGRTKDPMGGFEDLPEIIPPDQMWYQDVARWSFDSAKGVAASLPKSITAGVPVHSSYTFKMPENVLVPSNTECCILLVNALNSRIANACKVSLDFSGIAPIDEDNETKTVTGYWDINGLRHADPVPGLNIIRYSDGSTKKIFL